MVGEARHATPALTMPFLIFNRHGFNRRLLFLHVLKDHASRATPLIPLGQ